MEVQPTAHAQGRGQSENRILSHDRLMNTITAHVSNINTIHQIKFYIIA